MRSENIDPESPQRLPFERAVERCLAAIFGTGEGQLAKAAFLEGHRDLVQREESGAEPRDAGEPLPAPQARPVVVFYGHGYERLDSQDSCDVTLEIRTPGASLGLHDMLVQSVRTALSADNRARFGGALAGKLEAAGLRSLCLDVEEGQRSVNAFEPERGCYLFQQVYRATGGLLTGGG